MIEQSLNKLKEHFLKGNSLAIENRVKALRSMLDVFDSMEPEFLEALAQDLGKPTLEATFAETASIRHEISSAINNLGQWSAPYRDSAPLMLFPSQSTVQLAPRGVVLIISPWNYPLHLALAPLVGAIAAGNCAVIKPSEFSEACSKALAKFVSRALSPDLALVVQGGPSVTTDLLKWDWDFIFFTGSTKVGKIIAQEAAPRLIPTCLELGGKSPAVILDDTNLKVIARRIAWGKWMNAGQTCIAPDFVYCPRHLQDQLVDLLIRSLNEFYGPNPNASTDYAKIISQTHVDRLKRMAPESHPNRIVVGTFDHLKDRKFPPIILPNSHWDAECMQEEIFGPVLPILPYDNESDIWPLLQRQPLPLAFYVFTESRTRAEKYLNGLRFGGGCWNDCVIQYADPNLPFGGVGASGWGSYHGAHSFRLFSHQKSLMRTTTKIDLPFRYPPYTQGKTRWLKRAAQLMSRLPF